MKSETNHEINEETTIARKNLELVLEDFKPISESVFAKMLELEKANPFDKSPEKIITTTKGIKYFYDTHSLKYGVHLAQSGIRVYENGLAWWHPDIIGYFNHEDYVAMDPGTYLTVRENKEELSTFMNRIFDLETEGGFQYSCPFHSGNVPAYPYLEWLQRYSSNQTFKNNFESIFDAAFQKELTSLEEKAMSYEQITEQVILDFKNREKEADETSVVWCTKERYKKQFGKFIPLLYIFCNDVNPKKIPGSYELLKEKVQAGLFKGWQETDEYLRKYSDVYLLMSSMVDYFQKREMKPTDY